MKIIHKVIYVFSQVEYFFQSGDQRAYMHVASKHHDDIRNIIRIMLLLEWFLLSNIAVRSHLFQVLCC
jgi:hypothetical protein